MARPRCTPSSRATVVATVQPPTSRKGTTDMLFKRAVQRYGRTPTPETPYQRAGQLWDERIGSARVQARNWRLMAFGCLGLTRSEEHTSELQSLMRISYAVFCLKNKIQKMQH